MVHKHHITKAVLYTGKFNRAVGHGAHGCARGGGKVGAQVGAPALQDGVHPHREAAAHPRKLHWRRQEGAAHAVAVQGVITALGAGLLEPHGLVGFAAAGEFCAEHLSRAQGFAVGFQRFVHDRQAVATAQGAAEVDGVREDFGQLGGNRIRDVGVVGGRKECGAHGGAGQAAGRGQGRQFDAGPQAGGGFFNHQALEQRGFVL